MKISMKDNNEVIAEVLSKSKNIKVVEFVSEMIAFRAVFTDCEVIISEESETKESTL